MTDTKPQASATSFPSGGEKGVEELVQVFIWNPGAIISERNPDTTLHLLSFDAELSPTLCLGHSLLSIEDDVQEDLLNLMKINYCLGETRGEVGYNLNIARFQFVSPQFQSLLHNVVYV